jgi:hypothetical protein
MVTNIAANTRGIALVRFQEARRGRKGVASMERNV